MKCLYSVLTIVLALFFSGCAHFNSKPQTTGNDLKAVFRNARKGQPLRCVALGGSITQAGKGWIGPWLRKTFPNSQVAMHNAGMSATGSMLGMFRLERDVIACQPDLVLIEYAVNDGGASDESVTWTLESIIHRLKKLNKPPAIVFLLAASRKGGNIKRHAAIAKYYGFASIDLQAVCEKYLKKNKKKWQDIFGDNVHPNRAGHRLYTEAIINELEKYIPTKKETIPQYTLPCQSSKRKLILDGTMAKIALAPGWKKDSSLPYWWNRFFLGTTASTGPGVSMSIPFRAETVGLLFPLSKDYGSMYVSLDGIKADFIPCNHRGGYTYKMFGTNLEPGEHQLHIAVPTKGTYGKGVKLGYLLLGGMKNPSTKLIPQGEYTAKILATMSFITIPAKKWQWAGPFGKTDAPCPDKLAMLELKTEYNPKIWHTIAGNRDEIDYTRLTGYKDRGVCYAKTVFNSSKDGKQIFGLQVDYWAKVYVNGKLILTVDKSHGNPENPVWFAASLQKGDNHIMIKSHAGSGGNYIKLMYKDAVQK
jgi:lysophospholipase L1-like esterase